jgi:hormone-sensitive lipase
MDVFCCHLILLKVLPHTFLRLCIESYIGDVAYNADIDPLISPSKASDEILMRFPKTWILAGTNDPLHDESWRLA